VGKQRASLSDKLAALIHQDQRTADGVVLILRALHDRYPRDINLSFATKAIAEFSGSLDPGATPAAGEEPRG
jgi:hypothetical protein